MCASHCLLHDFQVFESSPQLVEIDRTAVLTSLANAPKALDTLVRWLVWTPLLSQESDRDGAYGQHKARPSTPSPPQGGDAYWHVMTAGPLNVLYNICFYSQPHGSLLFSRPAEPMAKLCLDLEKERMSRVVLQTAPTPMTEWLHG